MAKDAESAYRGGPTRSWVKVKVRREGRFVVGGVVGWPHTFAGLLVGQRVGRRLLYRGSVEWGLGLRTAEQIVRRAQFAAGAERHLGSVACAASSHRRPGDGPECSSPRPLGDAPRRAIRK